MYSGARWKLQGRREADSDWGSLGDKIEGFWEKKVEGKRGFITVDVAPADVDPGAASLNGNEWSKVVCKRTEEQKRRCITVDAAPTDADSDYFD